MTSESEFMENNRYGIYQSYKEKSGERTHTRCFITENI